MKQSWDGWANDQGRVMRTRAITYPIPVRVVPWGECPYPQEQVPQVNETLGGSGSVVLTPPFFSNRLDVGKLWRVVELNSNGRTWYRPVDDILKKPAPTVEIGGRRLLESEAVECCKELEPVDD